MSPTRQGVREREWKTVEYGSVAHFEDGCNAAAAEGWSLHSWNEVRRPAAPGSETLASAILATFRRDKQTVLIVKHT